MTRQHPSDEERAARETLERLRREPTFAGSSLAEAGRRAAEHFGGANPGEQIPDPIELWGRRIGRALSLAGCIALAIYLCLTYLR